MKEIVPTLILCLGKLGGKVGEHLSTKIERSYTKIVAIDTDLNLLDRLTIETLHIGKKRCGNLGCGENVTKGENACNDDIEQIINLCAPYKKIIVLGGLGKGFATGAALTLSDYFRQSQAVVVFVLTTPFSVEGLITINKANEALTSIRKNCNTVICLSNDLLFSKLPADIAVNEALDLATNYLYSGLQALIQLLKEDLKDHIFIEFSALSEFLGKQKATCSIANATNETGNFEELANAILENPLSGGQEFVYAADQVLVKINVNRLSKQELEEGFQVMTQIFKSGSKTRFGVHFESEDCPLQASCLFISYPSKRNNDEQNRQPELNLLDLHLGIFSGRDPNKCDKNSYSLDLPTFQRLNISVNHLD
jgi:cell division protein FtsZ